MGKHSTETLNTAHEYFILKVTCIGITLRQTCFVMLQEGRVYPCRSLALH